MNYWFCKIISKELCTVNSPKFELARGKEKSMNYGEV